MERITSPAFRWHGGKWRMWPYIQRHMRPHTTYVEPYGGSASILLQKPASDIEVFNDLDYDVVNFFQVLRRHSDKLIALIEATPYARAEFDGIEMAYRMGAQPADPIERARMFFILTEQGYAGKRHAGKRSWRRQKTSGPNAPNRAVHWANAPRRLRIIAERMRKVFIECRPALDILTEYDSEATLFYVDPPYVMSARNRTDHGYDYEMDDSDHGVMLSHLLQLQATVILSGYSTPLYENMLSKWTREEHSIRGLHANTQHTEVIWCNRESQLRLF